MSEGTLRCDACGIVFPKAALLETHRAKFCEGSLLHRKLLQRKKEVDSGLTNQRLDAETVKSLAAGLSALGDDVDTLSVSNLRERVRTEASAHENRLQAAKATAEHAAVRLAEQKAQAEVQAQVVEARLQAQRMVELQAKVQRRAAERMAEMVELQVKTREQTKELAELHAQQAELEAKRHAVNEEAAKVSGKMEELSGATLPAAQQLDRARRRLQKDELSSAGGVHMALSDEAKARRAMLLDEQENAARALQLERSRLLAQQRALEAQMGRSAPTGADAADAAGAGAGKKAQPDGGMGIDPSVSKNLRRLQEKQSADELRLSQLRREVAHQTGADAADEVEAVLPGRRAASAPRSPRSTEPGSPRSPRKPKGRERGKEREKEGEEEGERPRPGSSTHSLWT